MKNNYCGLGQSRSRFIFEGSEPEPEPPEIGRLRNFANLCKISLDSSAFWSFCKTTVHRAIAGYRLGWLKLFMPNYTKIFGMSEIAFFLWQTSWKDENSRLFHFITRE